MSSTLMCPHPILFYQQSFSPFVLQVWSRPQEESGINPDITGLGIQLFTDFGQWELSYSAKHYLLSAHNTKLLGLVSLAYAMPLLYSVHPLSLRVGLEHGEDELVWLGDISLPIAFPRGFSGKTASADDWGIRLDYSSEYARVYNGEVKLSFFWDNFFLALSLGLENELPFVGPIFWNVR
jgi:hypothetical protein